MKRQIVGLTLLTIVTLALLVPASSIAQRSTLRAVLNVSPHPTPYISEWANRHETATLIVTNTGNVSIQAKFSVEVKKDGSPVARTKPEKMLPVTIPVGISTWNAEQMIPFSAVDFIGEARTTAMRTGMLPAGEYEYCVDLLNPINNASLIGSQICRPFSLTSYQVPLLLQPEDQSALTGQTRPTFRWTAITPPAQGAIRYDVSVAEVLQGEQPSQVFRSGRNTFRNSVSSTTQLLWPPDISLPASGSRYVWYVRAYDDHNNPIGEPDGYSSPSTFTVQAAANARRANDNVQADNNARVSNNNARVDNNARVENHARVGNQNIGGPGNSARSAGHGNQEIIVDYSAGNPKPDSSTCTNGPPQPPVIVNHVPSTLAAATLVDSTVKVGFFSMKILTATGTSSALAGTGSILVPWLHTPVAVEFTSIKVNTDLVVWDGEVTTQIEATPDVYPKAWGQNIVGNVAWSKNLVSKLNTWMHAHLGKLTKDLDLNTQVTNFTNTPLKLPLGITNLKGYTIGISEMKFETTGAELNAVAAFPITEYDDTLGFKVAGLPCTTGGPSTSAGKVSLLAEQTLYGNIFSGDTYTLTIHAPDNTNDGTYVKWDCDGFKELMIDLDIGFPRSWLVPSPDTDPTKKSHSNIKTSIVDWNDWIVNATLNKSTIVGTNGLELEVQQMAFDHSDTRNPTGIIFPKNFSSDSSLTFHGCFIKSATIALPDKLRSYDDPSQKITIAVTNTIINKYGVTGVVTASNILNFPKANIANLGASIDTVKVELLNSSLTNAYMKGRIVLPVSDTTVANALLYKALFNSVSGFQFTLNPNGPIIASLWKNAKLTLDPTSTITVSINTQTAFDMSLDGGFEWANIDIGPVKAVTMAMNFEDLSIGYNVSSNVMSFDPGTWSFASPPKFMHNFPVTIESIKYVPEPKQGAELIRGGLTFDVVVNLDSNKIGGRTSLDVIGAIEKKNGKFVPSFKQAKITSITIFAHLAAVSLDGKVDLFSGDVKYGDGYKGTIKAVFNSIKMQVDATLQFGSTAYQNNNTKYRYWYVEAKVILPPAAAIPLFPGYGLFGGGLGAWRHMNVSNFPKPDPLAVAATTTPHADLTSGATFTPDNTIAFGFKVLAVIGVMPTPKTFNADAALAGQFSSSGGLASIVFTLDFWAAADLTERATAPVYGNAIVSYVPPDKLFDMAAYATFKYPSSGDIIRGNNINLKLHVNGKTGKWNFKLGEPTHLNSVVVLNSATVSEYLMFGNDINPPTGFLDNTINELHNVGMWINQTATIGQQATSGTGFAAGLTIHASTGNRYYNLFGRVNLSYYASAGFEIDMSMLKYPNNVACGSVSPIGMRGWYLQGGLAAWFYGGVGIHIDTKSAPCLFCCHHNHPNGCDYHILDIKLGAWVTAGFPHPVWVTGHATGSFNLCDGLVTGSFDANLNIGDACSPSIPVENNITYTAQDAAAEQLNDLIRTINPSPYATNFNPDNSIGIQYGFTPNDAFDVQEQQANGSLIYRTFQARYTVTLDSLGLVMPYSNIPNQSANSAERTINPSNVEVRDPSNAANTAQRSANSQTRTHVSHSNVTESIQPVPQPLVLVRGAQPNSLGEYLYRVLRPGPASHIGQHVLNMTDTTRYKLTVIGELWELKNNAWVKAKKRDNTYVSATKISNFNTGVHPPIRPLQSHEQNNHNNMQQH
ncbi:MAG: hypothetical protein ABI444_12575 [Candidatus Kapaibacterium sp.]